MWQKLTRLLQQNRLPHALLLSGSKGRGKRELAKKLMQSVLCQKRQANGDACGECRSCHLVLVSAHPDYCLIEPEEGHAIKVDDIRNIHTFIQNTSHQGGQRVVIIQPATAMNVNAANALLKILEEPPSGVLIILISDNDAPLPATIRSRCQQWVMTEGTANDSYPDAEKFYQDLQALQEKTTDPLTLAAQWKDKNLLVILDMFYHSLQQRLWQSYAKGDIQPLFEFSEFLKERRKEILGGYHPNPQLLLESLFIRWGA